MSPSRDDFRRELFRPASPEERLQQRQTAWETSTCRYLMIQFGLAKLAAKKEAEAAQEYGQGQLLLRDFNSDFPDFPLSLGALWRHDLHISQSCLLTTLFRSFRKSPLGEAYCEFEQEARQAPWSGNRPLGVVVPSAAPFARGLIIHEPCDYRPKGSQWVYQDDEAELCLIVEPFQSLVQAIHRRGHGWRPDHDS